jgi:hypothetical protein
VASRATVNLQVFYLMGWRGHRGIRLGAVTLLCVAVSILIRSLEVVCINFFEPRGVSIPLVSHLAFGGLHRLWLVAIAYGAVWLVHKLGGLSRQRAKQLWWGLEWAIAISIVLGLGAIGLELGLLARSV